MASFTTSIFVLLREGRRIGVLALLIAALAFTLEAQATGVYRWLDDQGNVHYGDRPPSKAEPTSVEIEDAPDPAPESSSRRDKTRRLLEALESEREREQAQAAQAKADKERREHACQVARRRVEFFERANTLFRRGSDGERTYLSEAERAQAVSQARGQVSKWCK